MLTFAEQQSDSVTHACVLSSRVLSIVVSHRILNIVPRVVQEDLVVYPRVYTSLYLLTPNSQSFLLHSPPPW